MKKKAQAFQLKATDKFGAKITFALDLKTASKSKKYITITKAVKTK
ncbi:MAG: hypothetical protein IKF90_12020 [Parasporobacterium sp.]|nr:hypothetical protein [Parasporobacterium sp.]